MSMSNSIEFFSGLVAENGKVIDNAVVCGGEGYPDYQTKWRLKEELSFYYDGETYHVSALGLGDLGLYLDYHFGCVYKFGEWASKLGGDFFDAMREEYETRADKPMVDRVVVKKTIVTTPMKDVVSLANNKPITKKKLDSLLKDSNWIPCKYMDEMGSHDGITTLYYCGKRGSRYNVIQVVYKGEPTEKSRPLVVVGLRLGSVRYK